MGNITYKRSADSGGPRHYLDGESISCGSRIDVLTSLGWMPGRFEISHQRGDDGMLIEDGKVPMFHACLPVQRGPYYATGSVGTTISFQINDRQVFRWPAIDSGGSRSERRKQLAAPPPAIELWEYCRECDGPTPPRVSRCSDCRGLNRVRGV